MTDNLTYYGKSNPLIEVCDFIVESVTYEGVDGKQLSEGVSPTKSDHMVLEGVLQRSDVKNHNKRTYPRKVWEKQLSETSAVSKKIAKGGMLGHLEHPKDGATDLNLASHLVREARLMPDGVVRGRIVVLKNVNGEKIESIINAGGQVGISSRGTGSVDDKGVVQDDYLLETWDVVNNPSTPGAHIAPPRTDEAANAVQESNTMADDKNLEAADKAAMDAIIAEDTLPMVSVEQDVLVKGAGWIQSKTGISDPNSLAMVHRRFLKWAKQRGPVDKTIEAAWASFEKVYPLMKDAAGAAAVPAGMEPSEPAKRTPMDKENVIPPNHVVPHTESTKAVDEAALGLLEAARGEIAKLTESETALKAQVATLTESNAKATKDLETSSATIKKLSESEASLQAKVDEQTKSIDKAAKTLAALTALDVAGQVREAVEEVVRQDARLAAHRELLDMQKTPAAVEAKAQAILATLAESTQKKTSTTPPAASLALRLRDRARTPVSESLPAKPVSSDAGAAERVEESVEPKKASKGALLARAAIRKIQEDQVG